MSFEEPGAPEAPPEPVEPVPPVETPAAKAEAARIRRRWLTLGEILAVAAVAISGLTFWNSYEERRTEQANRAAAERSADKAVRTLMLRAKVEGDGRRLALAPVGSQTIEQQGFTFPPALGLAPVEAMTDPAIDTRWFADALKKARKAAGRNDETRGIERLPIAIATRFVSGDTLHEDVALYELGYEIEGGFIAGNTVKLRGLTFVARTDAKQAGKRLDTLWARRLK